MRSISIIAVIAACAVAAVVLIIAVVVAASRKNTYETEGEKNMIKNIFHYLVLFATLMMTIGGSVSTFMAIADIVSPAPYYQSFENYKEMMYAGKNPAAEGQNNEPENISEEELRQRYNSIVAEEQKQARDRAVNSLIKSLGWIIIPLPVFLYYQRKLNKS